jgi:GH25 family lysozyme M1 (1,4-beta-N-acetylmuramidase)
MGILEVSNRLTCDFPQRVYNDILDHKFARRMQRYQRQYNGNRHERFKDFGEIKDYMDFEELVHVYEMICVNDAQNNTEHSSN